MKSDRQYRDSMTNFVIGLIGLIVTVFLVIIYEKTQPKIENKEEHNNIKTKEDFDWTGTTQGEIEINNE
tara:strand:+ start:343 stop:549 length:207 start_codon:yes stop_codon:yes gene_type:complete